MSAASILISEVGPRDGLQSIAAIMPTTVKQAWIAAEAACGVREIEVGSFVPPSLLPQLADTAQVVAFARTLPGLTVAVLVPNLKGAQAAIAAGAHKISIPLSVSQTHSLKNVRRTHDEMIEAITVIAALVAKTPADARPSFEVGLSTAFGCTMEGPIPEDLVFALAGRALEAGAGEVGLSDTTGYGNPAQVKRLVRGIKQRFGDRAITGLHLHNTRGLGLANALAGLEEGITTLDASLGGIGGCPFAPGASGNIVTEDLAFMLEAMGYDTGIDVDKLLQVRAIIAQALPDEPLYGFTPDAGLPLGFAPARPLSAPSSHHRSAAPRR